MKHLLSLLLILFSFSVLQAQVVINEFSAANLNDYTDNFGEYEDWVELYNAGATSVNLDGYYLSDKIDNPTKWQFPSVTIAANGYLVVFASKRDITTGTLHTNFKITQTASDEAFVLADPSGTIIDFYQILTPNELNHSTGRITNGAAEWGVFTNPTPSAANTGSKKGYAPTPDIEPSSGNYAAAQSVSIITSDPTATIYYTLNGSTPSNTSTLYAGPFTVSATTVVRAIAYSADPNVLPGFEEVNTYLIAENHTIPVISIAGTGVQTLLGGNSGIKPIGTFELFDENGVLVDEAVGEFNKHGNDSWAYNQRGFDYITRDEAGYDNEISGAIFPTYTPRDKFQRLIIKAAANDNYPASGGAHIRDAYVHTLSHRAGLDLDERTYEPCIVYLNGQYWGVYEIREKADDNDYTGYYYDQGKEWIDYIKTWGATWEEYGSWDDWYLLHDYILANDMTVPANYNYVSDRLNVLSIIDYMIINTHVVCMDWLVWNTAWWRGRKGDGVKWRYTLWDMDATFGHYINYTGIPDTSPAADPCFNEAPGVSDPEDHVDLVVKLMQNEDFHNLYVNRYADLNNTYFTCDYMIDLLDSLILRIEPEMPRHIAKWGGTLAGWEGKVQELRDFILARCTTDLDDSIVDCYDLDAPFDIVVSVDPPNSGFVNLNMLMLTDFPWTGTYFGGAPIDMEAIPFTGYQFDYWEVNNNIVMPGITDPIMWMNLSANDIVVAHFSVPIPTYNITLIVEPPSSGTISTGGFAFTTYPVNLFLAEGTILDLSALAAAGYQFTNWTSNSSLLLPDDLTADISFTLLGNDTITAYFEAVIPTYTLTVDANTTEGGTLTLDGTDISNTLPYTDTYDEGTEITLNATPDTGFTFDYWETSGGTILPDPQLNNITITLNADETVTAHFSPIFYQITITNGNPDAGNVTADGAGVTTWPYTITIGYGETIDLAALAAQGFEFTSWTLNGTTQTTSTISVTALQDYTISVNFSAIVVPPPPPPAALNCEPAMPNAFTPNNDGVNDNFGLHLNPACTISNFTLRVFDRWGSLVFETTSPTRSWNGINKGSESPMGTYVWWMQFDLENGGTTSTQTYKGNITLIR